jgi:hypothetical protein
VSFGRFGLSGVAGATVTEAGGVTDGAAGGVGGVGGEGGAGGGGEAPWLTCVGTGREGGVTVFDARAGRAELRCSGERATRL